MPERSWNPTFSASGEEDFSRVRKLLGEMLNPSGNLQETYCKIEEMQVIRRFENAASLDDIEASVISVSEFISNRIKYMPKGKPFVGAVFAPAGSRSAVNKALARMVLSGSLERVAHGVYMRPKKSEYTGKQIRANPIAVMKAVARARGETIQIHGAEAVRRLGLSTQMQVQPTYYTSGSTREIKVGNAVVRLRHVSRQRLQLAGTQVGVVLTALFYLGKTGLTEQSVRKMAYSLSPEEHKKLMACKMPKWMRAAWTSSAFEGES